MNLDLEQLGPVGFQELAGGLAIAAFGPAVQLMGAGPDGGRDLYVDGTLRWKAVEGDASTESWDGRTVFQVKRKDRISPRPDDDAGWLWAEIKKELDAWADPQSRRKVPDYLVVVTNVPLTPFPESGGHDRIRSNIARYIDKLTDSSRDIGEGARSDRLNRLTRVQRIKGWKIWDRNQINALLLAYDGVRSGFKAFFTPQDLLAHVAQFTENLPAEELQSALRAHARAQLATGDGLVYFDDAGGDTRGMPVHEVVIDLPIVSEESTASAFTYLLNHAQRVLRPGFTPDEGPRHLVVAGAPGNGKTKLSKFLVHTFRAAMLQGAEDLSKEHQRVVDGTRKALRGMHVEPPRNLRWPIRLDLAEYAHESAINGDSLIRWAAAKISKSWNERTLTAQTLNSWMRQWPCLVLLDGLDEVTDPEVRKTVLEQIVLLANEAEAERADLLIVVTTRPMGYDDIAPHMFRRIDLGYLSSRHALEYAERVVRMRHGADAERIQRVVSRLHDAASDESLKDLLRTPLQVLMLTFIIDQTGRLPPDRHGLFFGYYDAVFRRERSKPGTLARILQDYEPHIQRLHEVVGFELQCRSEILGQADASLGIEDLRGLTARVLAEADFKPDGKDRRLLEDIVTAATHRLVLIASRPDDSGMGFDVRSIQELMAGRLLISGEPELVDQNLRVIAPSPHWRNTWIFAAGGIFSSFQEHRRASLLKLIEEVDDNAPERLGRIVPIAPRLALDLIEDGMSNSYPKYARRLGVIGMRVLLEPATTELPWVARTMLRYAALGDEQHNVVAGGLRDALVESTTSLATFTAAIREFQKLFDELSADLSVRALATVKPRPGDQLLGSSVPSWDGFDAEMATSPIRDPGTLRSVADALKLLSGPHGLAPVSSSVLTENLSDAEIAWVTEMALSALRPMPEELQRWLRDHFSLMSRVPVAERLTV